MSYTRNLTEILDNLEEETRTVRLGLIIERFRYRVFGPLLLIPSLLVMLPTGAIPFVPALCGIIIFLIALQMILGRSFPWLPERVEDFKIPRDKLNKSIRKAKSLTSAVDILLQERMTFMLNPLSQRLIALVCLVLSVMMIMIGFIPMLPATLAVPVFFFGLGYTARDGLLIAIGYASIALVILGLTHFA